jgi:hypothetical protein
MASKADAADRKETSADSKETSADPSSALVDFKLKEENEEQNR